MKIAAGDILGKCRLTTKISESELGQVWLAKHLSLDFEVAVKILHPTFYKDETFISRLFKDAQKAANFDHENIIRIFDVTSDEIQKTEIDTPDNSKVVSELKTKNNEKFHYIIMKHVTGHSLDELVDKNILIEGDAINYALQALSGLNYAHKKSIKHHGLTLDCLLLTEDETVKISDFGFGWDINSEIYTEKFTETSKTFSAPFYMSPEQWDYSKQAGYESDIYSMGVALFKMLTGEYPIVGDTPVQIMTNVLTGRTRQIRDFISVIDYRLEKILETSLKLNAEERYRTIQDFGFDLAEYAHSNGWEYIIPRDFWKADFGLRNTQTLLKIKKEKQLERKQSEIIINKALQPVKQAKPKQTFLESTKPIKNTDTEPLILKPETKQIPQRLKSGRITLVSFGDVNFESIEDLPKCLMLKFSRNINSGKLFTIEEAVEKLVQRNECQFLILEMSQVQNISSTAISTLIRISHKLKEADDKIAILNPTKQAEIIFQMMSLEKIVPIFTSIEEVLNYFKDKKSQKI